jgi:hypothetical protein
MATISQICTDVRSKNAGPYWVTIDLFFDGTETFAKYARSDALGPELFARIYGVDAALVKHFPVENLAILKVSYPRKSPQGGEIERDMHCGQQFVRLLDVEVG